MPHTIVTRPDRTSAEVAADRKEANAFFRRYDNPNSQTQIDRLAAYFAYDWKLLCCDMEGREWARTSPKNNRLHRTARVAARRALKAAQDAVRPTLRPDRLRAYRDHAARALLPSIAVIRPVGFTEPIRRGPASFWARCDDPTSRIRRRLDAERVPFVQWLAVNPSYGPRHPTDPNATPSGRRSIDRYEKGSIRPAGMTPERALQIAIAALDSEVPAK